MEQPDERARIVAWLREQADWMDTQREGYGDDFTETLVRKSYCGGILNVRVCMEEVFYLNREDIFTARDDDILFSVNKPDKTVFVNARHVARKKPAVNKRFGCCFRVLIVFSHYTVSTNAQFARFAFFDGKALFIDDFVFPVEPRNAYCTYFVLVSYAKMYASRTR